MFDWIHAETGFGPILFYLAIVVVWTVLKKVSDLARRRSQGDDAPGATPAPPRTERRRETRIDPALQEFLESLTGQKIEIEPPAPRAAPLPLPAPSRETTPKPPPRIHPAYQTRPKPRPAPPPMRPRRPEPAIEELPEDAYLLQNEVSDVISQSEIGEHEHIAQRQVIGNLSALAGLEAMRIRMPSLQIPRQRKVVRGEYRVRLRGHDALEKAIVNRVIMGPPKAMGLEDETWCANH